MNSALGADEAVGVPGVEDKSQEAGMQGATGGVSVSIVRTEFQS
jgi:hypothetical protein